MSLRTNFNLIMPQAQVTVFPLPLWNIGTYLQGLLLSFLLKSLLDVFVFGYIVASDYSSLTSPFSVLPV